MIDYVVAFLSPAPPFCFFASPSFGRRGGRKLYKVINPLLPYPNKKFFETAPRPRLDSCDNRTTNVAVSNKRSHQKYYGLDTAVLRYHGPEFRDRFVSSFVTSFVLLNKKPFLMSHGKLWGLFGNVVNL